MQYFRTFFTTTGLRCSVMPHVSLKIMFFQRLLNLNGIARATFFAIGNEETSNIYTTTSKSTSQEPLQREAAWLYLSIARAIFWNYRHETDDRTALQ